MAISGDQPDLAAADGTPVPALVGDDPLQLAFTVDVERTIWRLATPSVELEIAFDAGEVRVGEAVEELVEMEIELKRGARRDLFDFAKELFRDERVRIGVRAKSERGYLLMNGEAPASFKAEAVLVLPGMTTAEAFTAIAHACLRHFRLNEAGVMQRRAPEAVHQARVAIRRLRSAFSLFKSILADDETKSQRNFLRELSQLLGSARNLDVFLSSQEPKELPPKTIGFERLARERVDVYEKLSETLDEPGFARRLLDLVAWIECGRWRDATPAKHPKRLRPADRSDRSAHLAAPLGRAAKIRAASRQDVRLRTARSPDQGKEDALRERILRRALFGGLLAKALQAVRRASDALAGRSRRAQRYRNRQPPRAELELDGPSFETASAAALVSHADARLRTEAELLDDAVASFARLKETPVFWT